jgi:hypothetical protein
MMDCELHIKSEGSSKKPTGRPVGSAKSGDEKRTRSKRAENQARYRARDLDGLACYMLDDLPVMELEMMLRAAGQLHAVEPDHETVRLALRKLVLDLVKDHAADAA